MSNILHTSFARNANFSGKRLTWPTFKESWTISCSLCLCESMHLTSPKKFFLTKIAPHLLLGWDWNCSEACGSCNWLTCIKNLLMVSLTIGQVLMMSLFWRSFPQCCHMNSRLLRLENGFKPSGYPFDEYKTTCRDFVLHVQLCQAGSVNVNPVFTATNHLHLKEASYRLNSHKRRHNSVPSLQLVQLSHLKWGSIHLSLSCRMPNMLGMALLL